MSTKTTTNSLSTSSGQVHSWAPSASPTVASSGAKTTTPSMAGQEGTKPEGAPQQPNRPFLGPPNKPKVMMFPAMDIRLAKVAGKSEVRDPLVGAKGRKLVRVDPPEKWTNYSFQPLGRSSSRESAMRPVKQQGIISVKEDVQRMNRYCWQKSGGTYDPVFESSSTCIFCSRGATCHGSNCSKVIKAPLNSSPSVQCPSSVASDKIPGLIGNRTLSNLTSSTRTPVNKRAIECYSTKSELFNWSTINNQVSTNVDQESGQKSKHKTQEREVRTHQTSCSDSQGIHYRSILRKSSYGRKFNKIKTSNSYPTTPTTPNSYPTITSTDRKNLVAEVMCPRKRIKVTRLFV